MEDRNGAIPFWECFFDDYPIMSPGSIRQSTRDSMLLLVRLLGFKCAEDKLEEFSRVAEPGVEVDCSHACEGKILIRNKQGRVEKVCAALRNSC